MLARFLSLWITFGLRGSLGQVDNWQLLGQTGLPSLIVGALLQGSGLDLPAPESGEFAAYLGYGLVVWIAVRLIVGPYFIWKESEKRAQSLAAELALPAQIEKRRMAEIRAEKRMMLIEAVRELHIEVAYRRNRRVSELQDTVIRLHYAVSMDAGLRAQMTALLDAMDKFVKHEGEERPDYTALAEEVEGLLTSLHNF